MPKKIDVQIFRRTPVHQTNNLEILLKVNEVAGKHVCSEFRHFKNLINFLYNEFSEKYDISIKVLDEWIALSMKFPKEDC